MYQQAKVIDHGIPFKFFPSLLSTSFPAVFHGGYIRRTRRFCVAADRLRLCYKALPFTPHGFEARAIWLREEQFCIRGESFGSADDRPSEEFEKQRCQV